MDNHNLQFHSQPYLECKKDREKGHLLLCLFLAFNRGSINTTVGSKQDKLGQTLFMLAWHVTNFQLARICIRRKYILLVQIVSPVRQFSNLK